MPFGRGRGVFAVRLSTRNSRKFFFVSCCFLVKSMEREREFTSFLVQNVEINIIYCNLFGTQGTPLQYSNVRSKRTTSINKPFTRHSLTRLRVWSATVQSTCLVLYTFTFIFSSPGIASHSIIKSHSICKQKSVPVSVSHRIRDSIAYAFVSHALSLLELILRTLRKIMD